MIFQQIFLVARMLSWEFLIYIVRYLAKIKSLGADSLGYVFKLRYNVLNQG